MNIKTILIVNFKDNHKLYFVRANSLDSWHNYNANDLNEILKDDLNIIDNDLNIITDNLNISINEAYENNILY